MPIMEPGVLHLSRGVLIQAHMRTLRQPGPSGKGLCTGPTGLNLQATTKAWRPQTGAALKTDPDTQHLPSNS